MALLRVLCSSTWALLLVNDIHQPHLSLNANKIATVGKQTSMAETVWSMIVLGCYLLAISQLLVNAQGMYISLSMINLLRPKSHRKYNN